MDKKLDAIAGFKMEVLPNGLWYRYLASYAEYGFHDPLLYAGMPTNVVDVQAVPVPTR